MELKVGAVATLERTISEEEVRAFGRLTGDEGAQHLVHDAKGRLMVHGLLVASLPTKVGGSMSFLARELTFEFLRPAWTGERLRCTVTATRVEPTSTGTRLESRFECVGEGGEVLMRGHARGVVPAARPSGPAQG